MAVGLWQCSGLVRDPSKHERGGGGGASVRNQAATTATSHGTRGPPEVPAWRQVCGSSGGLVRGLMGCEVFAAVAGGGGLMVLLRNVQPLH